MILLMVRADPTSKIGKSFTLLEVKVNVVLWVEMEEKLIENGISERG